MAAPAMPTRRPGRWCRPRPPRAAAGRLASPSRRRPGRGVRVAREQHHRAGLGAFERSTPALAQMKPCCGLADQQRAAASGRCSGLSRSTTSRWRGSPSAPASARAKPTARRRRSAHARGPRPWPPPCGPRPRRRRPRAAGRRPASRRGEVVALGDLARATGTGSIGRCSRASPAALRAPRRPARRRASWSRITASATSGRTPSASIAGASSASRRVDHAACRRRRRRAGPPRPGSGRGRASGASPPPGRAAPARRRSG